MICPRLTHTTFVATATFALLASGSMVAVPRTAAAAVPVLPTTMRQTQHLKTLLQTQHFKARKGWLSAAAINDPVVYVAFSTDTSGGVRIYPQNGHNQQPIGEIPVGAVAGIVVDNAGNLYVTVGSEIIAYYGSIPTFNNGSVEVFPKGQLTPSKKYTLGIAQPNDVAVGSDGTVYVADYNGDFAIGWVSVYRNGSVTPSATIEDFDGIPFAVTTDKANNLLISYINGFNGIGQLAKYSPGSTSGSSLGVSLVYPNGLTVDGLGNYVVADEKEKDGQIDVFSPGGKTVSQIAAFQPLGVAFNSTQTLLYDAENYNGVTVRAYPSGAVVNHFAFPGISAFGVALSPPAPR